MIKTRILPMLLCALLALLLTGCGNRAGNTVNKVTSKAGDVVSKAGEELSKAGSRMESDDRKESDRDTSEYDSSRVDSNLDDNSGIFTPDDDLDRTESDGNWINSDLPADNDTSSDLS